MTTSGGCQSAARIAEASVASLGHPVRPPRCAALRPTRAAASSRPRINREFGRSGALRGARTHFLIRRTESENISSSGASKRSLEKQASTSCWRQREPPISRSHDSRSPDLPVNLGGPRDELSAQQQPEACRRVRPRDATAVSASDLRLGSHKTPRFECRFCRRRLAEGHAERGPNLSELGAHRETQEIGAALGQGRDLTARKALGEGQRLL